MDALRAAEGAASPLRRSFQVSSRPRRLPFSVSFSPSGESVTIKGLPSTSISRFSCLLSLVAIASSHVQSLHAADGNSKPPASTGGSPTGVSVALVLQPLGLARLDDVRPRTHALDVALQLRPLADVVVGIAAPAQHGEQVGVGDGELFAHQESLRSQGALQVVETGRQVVARILLGVLRRILTEQGREPLVE